MKHTDILNTLIAKHNYQSYLEIGVQNRNNNFDQINCRCSVGVDPEPTNPDLTDIFIGTSDEYFNSEQSKRNTFDLIFIDGLHTAEQVKKDFENALTILNPGGAIMLHDCNPTDKAWTSIPRGTQKIWTGDVYKFASFMSMYMNRYLTVDTDFGCMIIRPRFVEGKYDGFNNIHPIPEISWKEFDAKRNELLNLISVEQFKVLYK
jgi:hypothetical protein